MAIDWVRIDEDSDFSNPEQASARLKYSGTSRVKLGAHQLVSMYRNNLRTAVPQPFTVIRVGKKIEQGQVLEEATEQEAALLAEALYLPLPKQPQAEPKSLETPEPGPSLPTGQDRRANLELIVKREPNADPSAPFKYDAFLNATGNPLYIAWVVNLLIGDKLPVPQYGNGGRAGRGQEVQQ